MVGIRYHINLISLLSLYCHSHNSNLDTNTLRTFNYSISTKLQDPYGRTKDEFGRGVAISQTTALIGAPESDLTDDADDSGKVIVFSLKNNRWNIVRTLDNGETGDYFGWSVALDSSLTAVVGAYRDCSHGGFSGAIYIFEIEIDVTKPQGNGTKIVASNAHATSYFGYSVAISRDDSGAPQVIVGAYGSDDVGKAFIYRRDVNIGGSWIEVALLSADDSVSGDRFGWSVDISNNHAVVGAPLHNIDGAAYVFWHSGNNWVLNQKLVQQFDSNTDDAMTYDFFGISVATGDGVIAIGTPGNDIMGDEAGAVYVYTDNSYKKTGSTARTLGSSSRSSTVVSDFEFLQILAAPRPSPHLRFGWSLAYDEIHKRFAVGTDTAKSEQSGSVYVYKYEDTQYFKFEAVLLPTSDSGNIMFGISCDVFGDHVLVGAIRGNGVTATTGTAYHFHAESRSEWIYMHTATGSGTHIGAEVFGVFLSIAVTAALIITGISFRQNLRSMIGQMADIRNRQRFSNGQELVSTSDCTIGEDDHKDIFMKFKNRVRGSGTRDTSIDVSSRLGSRDRSSNQSSDDSDGDLEIVHMNDNHFESTDPSDTTRSVNNMGNRISNVHTVGPITTATRATRLKSSLKKTTSTTGTSIAPPPPPTSTSTSKRIVPLTLL